MTINESNESNEPNYVRTLFATRVASSYSSLRTVIHTLPLASWLASSARDATTDGTEHFASQLRKSNADVNQGPPSHGVTQPIIF